MKSFLTVIVLSVFTIFALAQDDGINISIVAGPDKKSSSVKASGTIIEIITDDDRQSFKIGDANLKNAVKAYFGKKPNDAFVSSPTPWGDLYKTYNWSEVQRVLVVRKAEILSVSSNPTIISTKTLTNNSGKKATFNVDISETVTNTVSNSWTNSDTMEVKQMFKYQVGFLGTEGGGETTFRYQHTWGQTKTETNSTTVGSSQGISVVLDPNESVVARLNASRGTMKVRITYDAYLRGQTAVNYSSKYKGHHFWGLPISEVMKAGKISNSVRVTEDMNIGYYSNGTVSLDNE